MTIYDVIKRPLDTEKFDRARDQFNQYAFEVDRRATKLQVKSAIEQIFKVTVTDVQTQILRGKSKRMGLTEGRTSNKKRAIVTLKAGDAISLFEAK
jgi:large subunit ribosomal protein L23